MNDHVWIYDSFVWLNPGTLAFVLDAFDWQNDEFNFNKCVKARASHASTGLDLKQYSGRVKIFYQQLNVIAWTCVLMGSDEYPDTLISIDEER